MVATRQKYQHEFEEANCFMIIGSGKVLGTSTSYFQSLQG
jgi:hypothetical protein